MGYILFLMGLELKSGFQSSMFFTYCSVIFYLLSFLHKLLLKTSKAHPLSVLTYLSSISSDGPLFLAQEEIISSRYLSSSVATHSGRYDDLHGRILCHGEILIP